MEVQFSPETETRLEEAASRSGKSASQLVKEAVDRMLDCERHFAEAVEKGQASARNGDLLDHEEVVNRIEQLLG